MQNERLNAFHHVKDRYHLHKYELSIALLLIYESRDSCVASLSCISLSLPVFFVNLLSFTSQRILP